MLAKGLPLHKTEAASDPKTPVKTSEVKCVFEMQTKYRVATLKMKDMMLGKHYLADKIREKVEEGNRILTFDCVTQEDLDLIADAVITSKIQFLAVDPGVFTTTIARKLIVPKDKQRKKKILTVVGSVNAVTRIQMEELWRRQRMAHNSFVKTKELLESEKRRNEEIRRVVEEVLDKQEKYEILCVTGDGIYPENRIDFSEYFARHQWHIDDVSQRINSAFAEITERIFLRNADFQGIYTSGGDITVAVCKQFDTAGLRLLDEVLPLAAYGTFVKGKFEGTHIITKGGMVGESDAISKCVTYLKEKLYM
jgi:uncharacterized protein YgbK (DUF1537 family)